MAYSGAWIGGAVAAAEKERRRKVMLAEEEETMTGYAQDDVQGDWEFKIVRSESGAFRRPEVLQGLIEEQALAGWVLLEKLDDSRVRFKRPQRARARDIYLPEGVDPYRTQYGGRSSQAVMVSVVLGLLMLAGLGFSVLFMMGERLPSESILWTLVAGAGLLTLAIGFVAVVAAKWRSR